MICKISIDWGKIKAIAADIASQNLGRELTRDEFSLLRDTIETETESYLDDYDKYRVDGIYEHYDNEVRNCIQIFTRQIQTA